MTERLRLTGDLSTDANQALQPHMEQVQSIMSSPEDPRGWVTHSPLPDEIHHPEFERLKNRSAADRGAADKRHRDNMKRLRDAYDNWQ